MLNPLRKSGTNMNKSYRIGSILIPPMQKIGHLISKRTSVILKFIVGYVFVSVNYTSRIFFSIVRESDIWVFFGNSGNEFIGNSKYLYLYISENTNIQPIWLTFDTGIKHKLNERGYQAHLVYEPSGIYHMLRAGKFVTSSGISLFSIPFIGGAILIQLWHGVPLKSIDSSIKKYSPWRFIKFHFLFVNSIVEAEAFDIPFDKAIVSGYPRNDIFYRSIKGSDIGVRENIKNELENLSSERTIIGYFPTWRKFNSQEPPIYFEKLDEELEKMGAHLVIKPHRLQEYEISASELHNVTFHPPFGDPYPLFENIDVLMTDYSSIYFDYLHLDRPIIYFPYDMEAYADKRGFYLDYESVTPGPKANSFDELVDILHSVAESDEYQKERAEVRQKIFKYRDKNASQRIIDRIQEDTST